MKFIKSILIVLWVLFCFSCNEDKILEEIPLDFYSPENSYNSPTNIEISINGLYDGVRDAYEEDDSWSGLDQNLLFGTDFGRDARAPGIVGFANITLDLVPQSNHANYWWRKMYVIISSTNAILGRIADVEYPSDEEKNAALAEAMFFRAYAYRFLAYLYGGVPLVLEEVTTATRDYTRESRENVYKQCIADLNFATEHLPDIKSVKDEGRVSKEAAFHYLAEVYLANQEWDNAINAASQVINDPNFQLMTERFGSRRDEPGDVYWDLFRRNNQNRSSGNLEAIWVEQYEFNTEGGGIGRKLERNWGPFYFVGLKDPDGLNGFIGPTSKNGGVSIGRLRPTYYSGDTIWRSDWDNDIRNSEFNIKRDYVYDNPESAYFGKKVSEFPPPEPWINKERDYYPYYMKLTTPDNHPEQLIGPGNIMFNNNQAGSTCTDWYYARLAETFLIRAEAYLGKGDNANAANDINMVRERAHAKPVAPADVDIDYILDERLRELAYEEPRRLTLSRLGKCYERTVKYNLWDGPNMQPHNELFPIPYSEIERNTGAVLEQNPGYK